MFDMKTCTIDECNKPHEARGWCVNHYAKWRRHGDPLGVSPYNTPPPKGYARCRNCGLKPIDKFYTDASRRGTHTSSECMDCFSERRKKLPSNRETLTKRYRRGNLARKGMNEQSYCELLESQNGVCAICLRPERRIRNGKIQRLAIDHNNLCCPADKSCDKCIRGLLCEACNMGIGKLEHNVESMNRAISYLNAHKLETESEVIGQ